MNMETIECSGYCEQLSCSICRAELLLNNIYTKITMTNSRIFCDAINDMLQENNFNFMNTSYLENYAEKVRAFTTMHG
ncbi:hypothetical protein BH10PSE19_BH10PSE19_10950 [soil metagenome]